ncbi:MAG: S8 family serine peptidase [Elainella sp. Prado103]|nr:S8 family serine peptidase [Elainella sp. Prado103]
MADSLTDRPQELPIAEANPQNAAAATLLLRGGEALAVTLVLDRIALIPALGTTLAEISTQISTSIATDLGDPGLGDPGLGDPGLGDPAARLPIVPIVDDLVAIQWFDRPGAIDPPHADRLHQVLESLQRSERVHFVSPVYALNCSPGTFVYPTNQLTLQFQTSISSERMQQITRPLGLQILKLVAGVPKTFVFQVTGAIDPIKLAMELSRLPELVRVEPNIAVMRQPCYRPRDSDYGKQWYLQNEGGEALAAGSHIFAEAAWNLGRGKRSIAVAVVDGAIDLSHADFQSEGKLVSPLNLRPQPIHATDAPMDSDQHGTVIAQIAVANETGKGRVGVAPGCALMPIQVGDFFDDQTIEQISHWAIEQGADVVCWSWNAAAVHFPLSLRQQVALAQMVQQGRDGRGAVLIVAAGNADRPIDGQVEERDNWQIRPDEPTQSYLTPPAQPLRWLNGFAIHPDSLTVGACTSVNQKSAASNWGCGISLVAPSGQSLPTLMTEGYGKITLPPLSQVEQAGLSSLQHDQPLPIGGTSGASAIVAGVAALILSINPELTARQVRQILEQTADRIMDRRSDPPAEPSIGSYDADRYSVWYGYGKVNAVKAVQLAQQLVMPLPLPYRWQEFPNRVRLAIPDGDPNGVMSSIAVAETTRICDLEVNVEIDHEFLGDLVIALIPPWGTSIPLQSRSLGRLTQLKTTYSLENTLWLKSALNRSPQGTWKLHIIDLIPSHTGHLVQWQLNLGI